MASDATEPAFVWDESDDDSLVGAQQKDPEPLEPQKPVRHNPVFLAVFGGLYAVWSLSWILGVAAAPTQPASSLLDAVMYQFGEFLAIIAPPLWFGATWWLSEGLDIKTRISWLVVGLVLLLPLPLVLPVVLT